MNAYSVKTGMPSVSEALHRLTMFINMTKNKEKAIKIVHGYGSTGIGGSIRDAIRIELSNLKLKGVIQTYIPGESFKQMMGFDSDIKDFKHLLVHDDDYMKSNAGITYIIY